MGKQTLSNKVDLKEEHPKYTDKYFLRAKKILKKAGINPIVRYQVFARKDIKKLKGIDEAVAFIRSVAGNKVKIYAMKDGQNYKAKEPIMKLEGHVQDLIELETVYLGIISGALTRKVDLGKVRKNTKDIIKAAQRKPVIYFGARHFHHSLDEKIGKICEEEGFVGASSDAGAKAWNLEGVGTIPHALILSFAAYMHENNIEGNPTAEATSAFDKYIDKKVPRIALIDTFNKEITDSIETAKKVSNLNGVRIDTCGENYSQKSFNIYLPSMNVSKKYLRGTGVKIASVWALRRALDDKGLTNIKITVSSGFNAEKIKSFIEADKIYRKMYGKNLFDSIGTGSVAYSVVTTSDIVAYYNKKKKKWVPMSKVGRYERKSDKLEIIK